MSLVLRERQDEKHLYRREWWEELMCGGVVECILGRQWIFTRNDKEQQTSKC